jgi:hypothetical protein
MSEDVIILDFRFAICDLTRAGHGEGSHCSGVSSERRILRFDNGGALTRRRYRATQIQNLKSKIQWT